MMSSYFLPEAPKTRKNRRLEPRVGQKLQKKHVISLVWLNDAYEIAACIIEHYNSRSAHLSWFAAKTDSLRLQSIELGMDVVGDESSGRDTGIEQGFLIHLGRRKRQRLQHQFHFVVSIGGNDRKPAILPLRNVRFLDKSEFLRIKRERLLLIVDHYTT